MKLALVTPPASDPVTLAEAKAHLRLDTTDDDELVSRLIKAATARLDGADGLLGRALLTQSWKATLDGFPRSGIIVLPLPPCQAVTSLRYVDTAGALQTLDPVAYRVTGLASNSPAVITPAIGASWPATAGLPDVVEISFTAGYGAASAVPEPIREAILIHTATMFEMREAATAPDAGRLEAVPYGIDDLLANFRTRAF